MQILKKIVNKIIPGYYNNEKSYAQQGEDIIIYFLLKYELKINNFTYIDIGAHHPYYLSNTFFFYKKGHFGITVEPDPFLFKHINKIRRKDININCGIAGDEKILDFYILSPRTLSTFSKPYVDKITKNNKSIKLIDKKKVNTYSLNTILQNYNTNPAFISIDVEGFEMDILSTLDIDKYKIPVFCIEYGRRGDSDEIIRDPDILNFMERNNYFLYADTSTNGIFVSNNIWQKQKTKY